jgi:hypothetical protein
MDLLAQKTHYAKLNGRNTLGIILAKTKSLHVGKMFPEHLENWTC